MESSDLGRLRSSQHGEVSEVRVGEVLASLRNGRVLRKECAAGAQQPDLRR